MKIRKYKNGSIKMSAENTSDSFRLTEFLANAAGSNSTFAKLHQNKIENQPSKPTNEGVILYDSYFKAAARSVVKHQIVSTSLLQRKFVIGYFRASKIIEQLINTKIISYSSPGYPSTVLVRSQIDLENIFNQMDITGQIEESSSWNNRF